MVVDRAVTAPREPALRFDEEIVVETPADTFLVVRADGDEVAAPVFPARPLGVTNPLQVDADGDGR